MLVASSLGTMDKIEQSLSTVFVEEESKIIVLSFALRQDELKH